MVFDFFFCSSPGILRQPLHLARERETFSIYVRLMVLELASLEKKKKERKKERKRKKMTIFDFFRIRFLSFCTAVLELSMDVSNTSPCARRNVIRM